MTCHRSVTRDVTRDNARTNRVSHATHTTPHHTMSLEALGFEREVGWSTGGTTPNPNRQDRNARGIRRIGFGATR